MPRMSIPVEKLLESLKVQSGMKLQDSKDSGSYPGGLPMPPIGAAPAAPQNPVK